MIKPFKTIKDYEAALQRYTVKQEINEIFILEEVVIKFHLLCSMSEVNSKEIRSKKWRPSTAGAQKSNYGRTARRMK